MFKDIGAVEVLQLLLFQPSSQTSSGHDYQFVFLDHSNLLFKMLVQYKKSHNNWCDTFYERNVKTAHPFKNAVLRFLSYNLSRQLSTVTSCAKHAF